VFTDYREQEGEVSRPRTSLLIKHRGSGTPAIPFLGLSIRLLRQRQMEKSAMAKPPPRLALKFSLEVYPKKSEARLSLWVAIVSLAIYIARTFGPFF
jgi:hypothetical protein